MPAGRWRFKVILRVCRRSRGGAGDDFGEGSGEGLAGAGDAADEADEWWDRTRVAGEPGEEGGGAGALAVEVEPRVHRDGHGVGGGVADDAQGEDGDAGGEAGGVEGAGFHLDGDGAGALEKGGLGGGVGDGIDGGEGAGDGMVRRERRSQTGAGDVYSQDEIADGEGGIERAGESGADEQAGVRLRKELVDHAARGFFPDAGVPDGNVPPGEAAGPALEWAAGVAARGVEPGEESGAFIGQGEGDGDHGVRGIFVWKNRAGLV